MTQGTAPDAPAPQKDKETNHLSPMAGKFSAQKNPEYHTHMIYQPEPRKSWKPVHYFFYGSLMDEQQLAKVLRIDSPPVLQLASIIGYSIKMWGPYPALIDGPPGNIVSGMVYEVQEERHEEILAYYETGAYRCALCLIKPGAGGEQILGKTFVWASGPDDRNLSPGSFDLEAWKKARSASK